MDDLVLSDDGLRYAYLTRDAEGDGVVHDRGVTRFDFVVDGTLQFTGVEPRWACLAGEVDGRRLFVTVEDHSEIRPFEWFDFAGVADGGSSHGDPATGSAEALRAWVAPEAELILSGG